MDAKKPHVKYPCWWTYAIVGKDEEDLRLAAAAVTKGAAHRVAFSKLSAKKRYASLHVEIHVDSEEERNRYFHAFRTDPRIQYVL